MSQNNDVVTLATALQLNSLKFQTEPINECTSHYFKDNLLLLRHGERLDHVDRTWRGNEWLTSSDPPLSIDGKNQCFETALRYRWLQKQKLLEHRLEGLISYIVTSPYYRCVESAIIINVVAFHGKCALFVDPLLSDWGQKKVYRSIPMISGTLQEWHVTRTTTNKIKRRAYYALPCDAILQTLIPFLQSKVINRNIENNCEYSVSDVNEWIRIVRQWVVVHRVLPVWTDNKTWEGLLSSTETIKTKPHANDNKSKEDSGNGLLKMQRITRESKCLFYQENKNDLIRRCELFVKTHYLEQQQYKDESENNVPAIVNDAVAKERRTQIPKYLLQFHELDPCMQTLMGEPALISATNVLAVTHADVISAMIEVCCPRYLLRNSGYAVPACSRTILERINNYYRIPTLQERAQVTSNRVNYCQNKEKHKHALCAKNYHNTNIAQQHKQKHMADKLNKNTLAETPSARQSHNESSPTALSLNLST